MGTTWLFNVLQEMAGQSGTNIRVVADGLPLIEQSWEGNVLVKSHRADSPELIRNFDQRVPLFACVIVRDVEKTLQSLVRTQSADLDELIGWLEADLDAYEAVLPTMRLVAVIAEEWIQNQGAQVVSELARFLGISLTPHQCAEISQEFRKERVQQKIDSLQQTNSWNGEFKEYDTKSQWHAGHISTDVPTPLHMNSAQQVRVNQLQEHVDKLVARFSLLAINATNEHDLTGDFRAMDFIQARQALLAGNASVASGVGRSIRGFFSRSGK